MLLRNPHTIHACPLQGCSRQMHSYHHWNHIITSLSHLEVLDGFGCLVWPELLAV
jgi:hypothetical protein